MFNNDIVCLKEVNKRLLARTEKLEDMVEKRKGIAFVETSKEVEVTLGMEPMCVEVSERMGEMFSSLNDITVLPNLSATNGELGFVAVEMDGE